MQDQLVGYMLCALEVEEIAVVEQALEADAELTYQLSILRIALEPLRHGPEPPNVPTDLALRTCQRIRELRHTRCD